MWCLVWVRQKTIRRRVVLWLVVICWLRGVAGACCVVSCTVAACWYALRGCVVVCKSVVVRLRVVLVACYVLVAM